MKYYNLIKRFKLNHKSKIHDIGCTQDIKLKQINNFYK